MKPFLVGVTGNIGSGKSRLLKQLQNLGIFVIKADEVAKEVIYTQENKGLLKLMLGETICDESGAYNLQEVRRILFSNSIARADLGEFSSLRVWKEIEKRALDSGKLLVVVENAILFEQGWKDYFNLIVCVFCDDEEAIRRVTSSRNLTRAEVVSIIDTQLPTMVKVAISDIYIDTTHFKKEQKDASLEKLIELLHNMQ